MIRMCTVWARPIGTKRRYPESTSYHHPAKSTIGLRSLLGHICDGYCVSEDVRSLGCQDQSQRLARCSGCPSLAPPHNRQYSATDRRSDRGLSLSHFNQSKGLFFHYLKLVQANAQGCERLRQQILEILPVVITSSQRLCASSGGTNPPGESLYSLNLFQS